MANTEKNQEKKIVDLRERVTVYSTEKDPYHTTGDAMNVAPAVAEKLIKKGLATDSKPSKSSK
jgi:hypothetical protein